MATDQALRDWFERVVVDNYRLLYTIAYQILRNAATAEDAVQTGVLRGFRNIGDLADPEAVVGWLVRIVRNSALDIARQRKLTTTELVGTPAEPVDRPAQAEFSDIRDLLLEEIGKLSEGLASVVILRFFEGLDIDQIGQRLGLTSNAVRVRLHRGLENLRRVPRMRELAETSQP